MLLGFFTSLSPVKHAFQKNLSGANKQAANVESTLLKGEKQKRLREKAAQNNQISGKKSLLVKKTLKNLHMSEKCSTFAS